MVTTTRPYTDPFGLTALTYEFLRVPLEAGKSLIDMSLNCLDSIARHPNPKSISRNSPRTYELSDVEQAEIYAGQIGTSGAAFFANQDEDSPTKFHFK